MPFLVHSATRDRRAWRERSDRELLAGLAKGDEHAFDELISRKAGPLMQLAHRMVGDREEARDLVQLTFVRAWENRDRYDPQWAPNTWLYRIATNLAIDYLRSRGSREKQREPVQQHLVEVAESRRRRDLSRLEQGEVLTILHELASELSERQRAVFLLREVEELSSSEVAKILGCRASTVRNHLFAARKQLREALLDRYPEYAPKLESEDSQ